MRNGKPLSLQEFVDRSNIQHNNFYDYSKVIYKNARTKVCIICPIHKEFFQRPLHHLSGKKCSNCKPGGRSLLSKEEFIERSVLAHGLGTYDYSKVIYKGFNKNVCIICPRHKEFLQTPDSHMRGARCPECVNDARKLPLEEFISRAREVHGNKYDYSKVEYINNRTKVCIICPLHGEFWQPPCDHLNYDCLKCGTLKFQEKMRSTSEEFINKAISLHGNRYDYSKVDYKGANSKVCIICRRHGEFWQTPNDHLGNHNCAKCHTSIGEETIKVWLDSQNIPYETQYKLHGLVGKSRTLRFDFYIPSKNLLIEFDGEQHYRPVKYGGSSGDALIRFEYLKYNDALKDQYCEKNTIPLLRIGFKEIKKIPGILTEKILKDNNISVLA